MAWIFSNTGAGIAEEAGKQSNFSKVLFGDSNHYANEKARVLKKLEKKGKKEGAVNMKENFTAATKRNVSDYLSAQDLNYKDTKHLRTKARLTRGVMAGTAIGAAVLTPRLASGGTLTVNNKGEKDIAGIPFVQQRRFMTKKGDIMSKGKIASNSDAAEQSLMSMLFNGNNKGKAILDEQRKKELAIMSREMTKRDGIETNVVERPYSKTKRRLGEYLGAQDMIGDAASHKTKAMIVRNGGLAVAGTAAMLTPRFLSGGNMTTNSRGEKDIAGIPFV